MEHQAPQTCAAPDTFNRGRLFRLAKAGRLTLVESYDFDDQTGAERLRDLAKPVALRPRNWRDRQEGTCYLLESDFRTKTGCAWLNPNGTVTLIVHSNCNYTFRLDETRQANDASAEKPARVSSV